MRERRAGPLVVEESVLEQEHTKKSFPRSSPYWPVLTHHLLRRVLPGMGISAFGDGMALVAVSWLALQIVPAGHRATWVAAAVAAYELPAILGAITLGRFVARRGAAQLVCWDAALRGVALALIPVAYYLGFLTPVLLVVLLAVSSLMHSWGSAGQFSLIAEVLPERSHVPANALLTIFSEAPPSRDPRWPA
jgi:MFS family permease